MLATVRRGYLTTNSGQIHYYHAGDSGPLLFLFHETALSASEFERTLPFLGTRCRAIALDTPGYGMSDAPHQPLSMAALSAQFTEAINNFGNEPCILAGAHTGSSFALELATRQLAARTTHVIISGLALLSAAEVESFRKIISQPELDADGAFLVTEWRKRRERWGPDATPADLLWGTVEQLRVFERFHWAFEAVFAHDAETALRRINCPTLFLVGEHDSLASSDRKAARLVRDSRLEELPGVHGRLPYFHPELYAQQILQFAGLA